MTLEQWLEAWEAAVEAGQSNISRDEAVRRWKAQEDETEPDTCIAGSTVFVVVEDMETDHGGGASACGVYSTEAKANAEIARLESKRSANPRLYKYRTSWFVQEHELDQ